MRGIKAVLTLQWIDTRFSLLIFWSILTAVMIGGLLISLTFTEGTMVIGGAFSVYIYLAIHSFINVRETFPFALAMGSTRRNYYIGTFIAYILLAALTSLMLLGFHYVGKIMFSAFGVTGQDGEVFLTFLQFAGQSLSPLATLWFDFIVSFLVLTLFQLLSSILFRFGGLVALIVGGLLMLSIVTPGVNTIWMKLFAYFITPDWFQLVSIWFPVVGLAAFLLTTLLMKRSSSRPV